MLLIFLLFFKFLYNSGRVGVIDNKVICRNVVIIVGSNLEAQIFRDEANRQVLENAEINARKTIDENFYKGIENLMKAFSKEKVELLKKNDKKQAQLCNKLTNELLGLPTKETNSRENIFQEEDKKRKGLLCEKLLEEKNISRQNLINEEANERERIYQNALKKLEEEKSKKNLVKKEDGAKQLRQSEKIESNYLAAKYRQLFEKYPGDTKMQDGFFQFPNI